MTVKSTPDRYGSVATTIHWVSALLILILLGSGMRADGTDDVIAKSIILRVHVSLGIAVLVLTLARIVWWLVADTKPAALQMPRWQDRLSRAVHVLFYVVIAGMAASGIGMLILSGAGPIIFFGPAESLPDFWDYAPRTPHGIGAKLLFGLFVVHAGAALYHQFIVKDDLLRRMWY